MKLAKTLQKVLRQLGAAGCSWTPTMDDQRRDDVSRLERLGLVKLHPLYQSPRERGKCRSRLEGYYVLLTPAGKDLL